MQNWFFFLLSVVNVPPTVFWGGFVSFCVFSRIMSLCHKDLSKYSFVSIVHIQFIELPSYFLVYPERQLLVSLLRLSAHLYRCPPLACLSSNVSYSLLSQQCCLLMWPKYCIRFFLSLFPLPAFQDTWTDSLPPPPQPKNLPPHPLPWFTIYSSEYSHLLGRNSTRTNKYKTEHN